MGRVWGLHRPQTYGRGGSCSRAEPVGPAGFGVLGGISAPVSATDGTLPGIAIKALKPPRFQHSQCFAGPGGLHKGGKYCQQRQVQRFLREVAASFRSFRAPERRGVTLGWTDGQSPALPRECGICWLLARALGASPATREWFWALGRSSLLVGVLLTAHKHLGLPVTSFPSSRLTDVTGSLSPPPAPSYLGLLSCLMGV